MVQSGKLLLTLPGLRPCGEPRIGDCLGAYRNATDAKSQIDLRRVPLADRSSELQGSFTTNSIAKTGPYQLIGMS